MKEVVGFPNYLVNEQGEVFSRKRNFKKLKAAVEKTGYEYVGLYNNGKPKKMAVHRIVASAYIPNPENKPCVNHKDLDKTNNCVENLEWCDYKYNNLYGGDKSPISSMVAARSKEVLQIKDGTVVCCYKSASEAQRKTGICESNISHCCLHRKYFRSAGGYQWEFSKNYKFEKEE